MGRWLGGRAGLLGLAVAAVVVAGSGAPPVAQVDVFTAGAAPRVDLSAPEVSAAVSEAVAGLGEERAAGLVRRTAGSAIAADPAGERVLRAVEVRQIGDDRIRIRLASRDVEAAHVVTDAVRAGLVDAGMRERLRITAQTTGGRALLVAALAVVGGLGWAAWTLLRHGRSPRPREDTLAAALRHS